MGVIIKVYPLTITTIWSFGVEDTKIYLDNKYIKYFPLLKLTDITYYMEWYMYDKVLAS